MKKFTFGKLLSLTIGVLGTLYFGNKVAESVKDIVTKEPEEVKETPVEEVKTEETAE